MEKNNFTKYIKKTLFMTCIVSTLTGILGGCGKENYGLNPKDPQSIVLWHYYNGAQEIEFQNLVDEFNNTVGREQGIIVYEESKSSINGLSEAVMNAAQRKVGAGELPNLFLCYQATAVELDEMGMLGSYEPYLTKEDMATYIDAYLKEGKIGENDELKLFPTAKSTEVLILNKTDWDKFSKETGVTEDKLATWEGLAQVAAQYYEWSNGEAFFGRDAFANYMVIGAKQLGSEFFPVNKGEVSLQVDEEVCRRLWDNFYVPYVKGHYTKIGRFSSDDIKLGKIIAQVCSTTSATYFPDIVTKENGDNYPVDYYVLPTPNFQGCEPYVVQQGANMAMKKATEKEEYACTVFLKWFTDPKQNLRYSLSSGYLPVKKEANQIQVVQKYFQEQNLAISDVCKETICVALEELNEYQTFASKGFVKGDQAREVLNSLMMEWAIEDVKVVRNRIQKGEESEQAMQEFLSEQHFQKWYRELCRQLEDAVEDSEENR